MNLSGAEKLSVWLGDFLSREVGMPDRRSDAHLSGIWEEKIAAYEAEKQAQYEYYGIDGGN